MILFLRNDKRESIVDIDCYVKTEEERKFVELHASVIIKPYSEFLLKNLDRKDEIISDFSEIDELRGWLWESYFMGGDNDPKEYDNIIEILRKKLKEIATKYKLAYVED
ncbi:MAG: hypothetical protein WC428_01755 [Candidatus Paceibacterota bacterium]|jgi:hypothetical protein